MFEMNLKQLGFTPSGDTIQKNKTRIKTFRAIGDSRYIYGNELDKLHFQNDMACKGFKGLPRKRGSKKYYKHGVMVYDFVDKKAEDTTTNKRTGIF